MARFRVLMNRHHNTYNPGETPVLSEHLARQAVASGAGEIVEELADEAIHGHPTGGAVSWSADAVRQTWRTTDDADVVAAIHETLTGLGRLDLLDLPVVPVAELPITSGIQGEPLGGDAPPAPATQADVVASLGQNRAHKPNERRKAAKPAAPAAPVVPVAELTTDTVIDDAGEAAPVAADAGLDSAASGGDTVAAGASADVDPFAGAES